MLNLSEKRHSRISVNHTKLDSLAGSHPFTQQVDIILPSGCIELETALSNLGTRYGRGNVDLANIFAAGPTFVRQYAPGQDSGRTRPLSSVLALCANHDAQSDDAWCIDTLGVLTLCVCKETYEKLGLVGPKLPFKHQNEYHVISLPLHENAESAAVQKRRRSALESWDTQIAADGLTSRGPNPRESSNGVWDIVFCSTTDDEDNNRLDLWVNQVLVSNPTTHKVTCETARLENIWVPNLSSIPLRPRPKRQEDLEDWEHEISSLFEWVGMAGIHAQRLKANDRVNPYVALYEPPTPSMIGNVIHLRWRGLLSPNFVQSVIDTSTTYLQAGGLASEAFIAITAHGITNSPVVYLPQSQSSGGSGSRSGSKAVPTASSYPQPVPPAHLPRRDAEDTWCVVLTPPSPKGAKNKDSINSILVESVGQWDARWG